MIRFEPVPNQFIQFLAHGSAFHAFNNLAGKRMDQHPSRRVLANAAGAQIKNALIVQLANGRAMRALHVVGVNFKLRLGVGAGVVGEQEIFVRLLRVGFLRDGMNVNATVESAL